MIIGSVSADFDRHPRVERAVGILEDDLHLAAHLPQVAARRATRRRRRRSITWPAVGFDQPQDRPAGGRLAAARFADEAERLAAVDVEADAVDGVHVVDRRGAGCRVRTGKWTLQVLRPRAAAAVPSATALRVGRVLAFFPRMADRGELATWGCSSRPRPCVGRVRCSRASVELLLDDRGRRRRSPTSVSMKSATVGSGWYVVSSRGRQASRPFV